MILKNYLIVAWRKLIHNRTSSIITIAGLSIGLAITLLMILYVNNQLSFDKFHPLSDQIYRVISLSEKEGGSEDVEANLFAPLGPLLENRLPDVQKSVRFAVQREAIVSRGKAVFLEEGNLYTDPSFFDVFSFELLQGNPDEVLIKPFSVVVTPEIARKYFGNENPVGKILTFDNEHQYEVTGVVEKPSTNSSIQYDFLLSMETLYKTRQRMIQKYKGGWGFTFFNTFVQLENGASASKLEDEVLPLIKSQTDTEFAVNRTYKLESLNDIYLQSEADNRLGPSSDIKYIYIFSIAALLVLIISCFNYTNLAAAQYTERAKEIGIRKTAGADRGSLIMQFLGESVLISLLSLIVALLLIEIIGLKYLNTILNINLSSELFYSLNIYSLGILGITLLTGLLAGIYPALILSGFNTSEVFRSSVNKEEGVWIRKGLVIMQFSLSIGILISTVLIHRQLAYTMSKNLGLEPNQVMVIPDKGGLNDQEAVTLRNQLQQYDGAISASVSGGMITKGTMGMSITAEGVENEPMVKIFSVDDFFDETFDLQLKSGRFFYNNIQQDAGKSVVVNETLVEKFGWKEPLGKKITYGGTEQREVVGVVKNFHFESLHNEVSPVLLIPYIDSYTNHISVKFKPGQTGHIIETAKRNWETLNSDYPFEYFFLDESFEQLYRSERQMASVFNAVTILTIVIACMGLYGLAMYMVRRRTKEIGIRKILGADLMDIVLMVGRDFMLLVAVGFLIAIPAAWYFINNWLSDFAYRIDIGVGIFLAVGVAVFAIALLAVSWQALRAALINPVESLRSE